MTSTRRVYKEFNTCREFKIRVTHEFVVGLLEGADVGILSLNPACSDAEIGRRHEARAG